LTQLWRQVDRRALVVTAVCLVMWRLLEQIPVTDVTPAFITGQLYNLSHVPGFFAAIGPNSLPFASWSLAAEGIGPYVAALILMSVLAAFSTRMRGMARDAGGRRSLARWTRGLALVLALGQASGFTVLLENTSPPVFGPLDWSGRLAVCLALTGGTALMILLADALDEFGLGFGSGALILYALGPLASEVHRLADYVAFTPSLGALVRPLAVWAAFTIALTTTGVAVLLAVRRVAATDLRVLWSGVLRPPVFTFALMLVPTIVANYYYASHPEQAQWVSDNWQPYGSHIWVSAAYLGIEACLVVLFAMFVAAIDERIGPVPSRLRVHVARLSLLGGVFLALGVIAVPAANHWLTQAAGQLIPVSGAQVLLVVSLILITVRALEVHKPVVPFTASASGLP
jgi:preprotein translocase subunit SecY